MARPKTRGPTIGFTLAQPLHDELVRRANRAGMSVGMYAAEQFTRALGGTDVRPALVAVPDAGGCAHVNRVPLGGGLARCKDCGATRQMSGRWAGGT